MDHDELGLVNDTLKMSGEFTQVMLNQFSFLLQASLVGGPKVMIAFQQEMQMVCKRMMEYCKMLSEENG